MGVDTDDARADARHGDCERQVTYAVDQMTDLENIRLAIATYCRGLDRLDGELMKCAYWPEAVDERFDGTAWEYVDSSIQVHENFRWTMHCVHNQFIEFDPSGTTARGEVYVTAHLCSDSPATLNTFFGRYLDRYEKRSGGEWRIIRRVCVHEDAHTTPSSRPDWPFDALRPGSSDRRSSGRPVGP
jgi:hypothetical protein